MKTGVQTYQEKRNRELGEFVRQTRQRCHWSQQQLADYIGLSRPTIVRLEKGEIPIEVGHLDLICHAFGLNVQDFCRSFIGYGKRLESELKIIPRDGLPAGVLDEPIPLSVPEGFDARYPYGPCSVVERLQFASDGQLMAIPVEKEKAIVVWEMSGEVRYILKTDGWPIGLAFSPDNSTLAGILSDGQVFFWSMRTGQQIGQLGPRRTNNEDDMGELSPLALATFSPNQLYLAIATKDQKGIRLISCHDQTFQDLREIDTTGEITDMTFAPGSNILFFASRELGVIFAYTIPDGKPWWKMTEGFLGNPDIQPEKLAILSGQDPGEYLVVFGGDGEGIDVERVQVTAETGDLSLSSRFFALPNCSNAWLDQLVAVNADCILTVVNDHIKDDVPYCADEIRNIFKVKNIISGQAIVVLDMIESTPHVSEESEWYRARVKLSGDGCKVAIHTDDGLFIYPLTIDALRPVTEPRPQARTVTMMGHQISYLPNLLYNLMGGIGHPEIIPYDRKTFLLPDFLTGPWHEQCGVVLASEDDHSVIPELKEIIRRCRGDDIQLLTVIVPLGRDRMLRLASTILETVQQGWTEQDITPEELFTTVIPRALRWQSHYIILIDHAERLNQQELYYLMRDHPLKWQPLYILVGRTDELISTMSSDLSLAYKSTLIPRGELRS
jgi:transcriptional regulator with XRE-family HTH domain